MHDTVKTHAIGIVKRLADAGFKALFAGGAVRDMVLGVEPKDYDIVTNASLADTERLFDRVIPVGKQFGRESIVFYQRRQFRIVGRADDAHSNRVLAHEWQNLEETHAQQRIQQQRQDGDHEQRAPIAQLIANLTSQDEFDLRPVHRQ